MSFYNEGPSGAIDPTPVIGMIGLIQPAPGSRLKARGQRRFLQPPASSLQPVTAGFKDEGDGIVLLGKTREELGGSEYLAAIHGRKVGRPPRVDLPQEYALQRLMVAAHARRLLKSAHDCSDGGLAVALAECCISDERRLIGAVIASRFTLHASRIRPDALLFGESAGRIVVSCAPDTVERLLRLAKRHGVPAAVIGRVGGARLAIEPWVDAPVVTLSDAWRASLQTMLGAVS